MSRAACKVPHCQKWDCHALPLFALDRVIPRLFSISILIAGETKNGRAKSTRWSVWQPCFWDCDMTLRTPPAASKVHQNNETTQVEKDDTNIHVLNWGGPPLGVRKFRLTTTSRVRARRPTLGVRAAPAMPIKLAKTRKQTKLKLSDLTSLNLTFFSQHTKRQVKCPWLCSSHCAVSLALLFCC